MGEVDVAHNRVRNMGKGLRNIAKVVCNITTPRKEIDG
jgi:hypothetical protein